MGNDNFRQCVECKSILIEKIDEYYDYYIIFHKVIGTIFYDDAWRCQTGEIVDIVTTAHR